MFVLNFLFYKCLCLNFSWCIWDSCLFFNKIFISVLLQYCSLKHSSTCGVKCGSGGRPAEKTQKLTCGNGKRQRSDFTHLKEFFFHKINIFSSLTWDEFALYLQKYWNQILTFFKIRGTFPIHLDAPLLAFTWVLRPDWTHKDTQTSSTWRWLQ